jgi:hypothetical protein
MSIIGKLFGQVSPLDENEIYSIMGKELNDTIVQKFIEKHKIISRNPLGNDSWTLCENSFMMFDYHKHTSLPGINSITIKNNNNCKLPFAIDPKDNFKIIIQKIGMPDVVNYFSNAITFYNYPKEIWIEFNGSIEDENNSISKIRISEHSKKRKSKEELEKINSDIFKAWHHQDKSFGINSGWIAIKYNNLDSVLSYFGMNDKNKVRWSTAFENTSITNKNYFITPVISDWIFIVGWKFTNLNLIDKNCELIKLSKRFGEVFVYENNYHYSFFKWGHLNNGNVIRFYSEGTFIENQNIGSLTAVEEKNEIFNKKTILLNQEEEYITDQDVKREYRKYMNKIVLDIASDWSLDPRLNNEIENIPEYVYYKENNNR